MSRIKRPPPSQDANENSKDHPPKCTLLGFPPPPTLSPLAPRNPSQWAASLNVSVSDIQASAIPPAQPPNRQIPSQRDNSDCLLHENYTQPPPDLQRPISPIRTSSHFPPRQTTAASRLLARFSERPMPRNENDMTMLKILDQILIPRYLESNPKCVDNGARCKQRYQQMMRFRHMKLISRVERWRLYIPFKEEDEELQTEREGKKDELDPAWRDRKLQRSLKDRKKRRDRKNLTDYVNGRVEGVSRGRLMCWPVLIRMNELYAWGEKELNTLMWVEEPGSELEVDIE